MSETGLDLPHGQVPLETGIYYCRTDSGMTGMFLILGKDFSLKDDLVRIDDYSNVCTFRCSTR